jgi:O-antigen/teichoic acid export membrane protein
VIAILLSLQTLLVILDLGLAISIGRDVASLSAEQLPLVRAMLFHAEKVLAVLYAGILLFTLVARLFFDMPLGFSGLLVTVLLFGAITHQNVSQVALLARQDYVWAGAAQLVGVVSRHLLTLAGFHLIEATLDVFVWTQLLGAVLFAVSTRMRLLAKLPETSSEILLSSQPAARRLSMALLLQGVAGACVMQLDKPIVGALTGAAQTAPYYLATVLSLTPLTFLAGPMVQFFQPKLMAALSKDEVSLEARQLRFFLSSIVATAFVPGLLLWLAAVPVTELWLRGLPEQPLVAEYTRVIVVGATIGALGYVPHVLLVARQEYAFLASSSSLLTLMTLLATTWAAWRGDVRMVCYIYAVYHVTAAVVLWWRARTLDATLRRVLAPATPMALMACAGFAGACFLLQYLLH